MTRLDQVDITPHLTQALKALEELRSLPAFDQTLDIKRKEEIFLQAERVIKLLCLVLCRRLERVIPEVAAEMQTRLPKDLIPQKHHSLLQDISFVECILREMLEENDLLKEVLNDIINTWLD